MRTAASLIASTLILAWTGQGTAAGVGATPPKDRLDSDLAGSRTMLAKAAARVKAVGREKAFGEFTGRKAPFFETDRYVVCVDAKLVVVAHGGFPTYVGSGSFFKDANGKVMAPVIWEAATKGNGTVTYVIRDEETNNKVEHRLGLFQKVHKDVCGVVARAGTSAAPPPAPVPPR